MERLSKERETPTMVGDNELVSVNDKGGKVVVHEAQAVVTPLQCPGRDPICIALH